MSSNTVSYRDLIGIPFKVHGRDKNGYDCYGLAVEVLKRNRITMPDIPYNDFGDRDKVHDTIHSWVKNEKLEKPVINCIIEFNVKGLPLHIGVYIGDGMFIHCLIGIGVVIEPLYRWKSKIMGMYKVC